MKDLKEKIRELYFKIKKFLNEVWNEVNPKQGKVSWPNRKMIMGSTAVVIVCVLIITLYIYIIDAISITLINQLVGRR
ncbi:MAG: preprotein translocase subunit SecE [Nitrospirota bacterium]